MSFVSTQPTELTAAAENLQSIGSSLTVQSRGTASATVTLASLGNFADTLVLSCVSPPAYVTCTFVPNPAALSAN